MFAELRHGGHVSLCVLARWSACACEATPEIARALLSRHSVALRKQWLSAPTMLALEAGVRQALTSSGQAEAQPQQALSGAGILGGRGHASVTAAALTIPGVPSALPTLRFPSSSCPCCAALSSPRPDKARVSRVLHTTGWAAYKNVPVRCRNVSQCVLVNKYVWYNYVTDCEQLVAAGRGVTVLFPEQRVGSHDGLASADVTTVGASLRFLHRRGSGSRLRGSSGWPDHPRRSQNQVVPRLAFLEVRHPSARAFGWFYWWR